MFHVEPDRRYQRTQTRQREIALAGGLQGIADTLRFMNQAVDQYKTHPQIRELALSLTRGLAQKDYAGETKRLFDYVQKRIRYVRDINGVETLQTPPKTLEYGAGDCDDKAMLLATLLQSLGHDTRFKAMGMRPGSLSHVSVETKLGDRWVNLETTEPVALGWAPPYIAEQMYGDQLDGLDGFFSKAWSSIKGVGRKLDKIAIKMDPLHKVGNKVIGNKYVQMAAALVGTVFPPALPITIAINVAGTAQQVRAADSANRKMAYAIANQNRANDPMAQQAMAQRYVHDASTGLIREATATDVGVQQYILDPKTSQLMPAQATAISATVPGLAIGDGASYPLPYAASGYPAVNTAGAGIPQVQFVSPSGGLTTVAPIASTSATSAVLKNMPWLAIGGVAIVGLVLLAKTTHSQGASHARKR